MTKANFDAVGTNRRRSPYVQEWAYCFVAKDLLHTGLVGGKIQRRGGLSSKDF